MAKWDLDKLKVDEVKVLEVVVSVMEDELDTLHEKLLLLILDGSDKQAQVPDGDLDEKGRWIDNLNLMMPDNLNTEEIASSLMSLASMYMNHHDMERAFISIGRMLNAVNEAKDSISKGSMH